MLHLSENKAECKAWISIIFSLEQKSSTLSQLGSRRDDDPKNS